MNMTIRIFLLAVLVGAVACSTSNPPGATSAKTPGERLVPLSELPDIDTDAVLAHTKALSSDEFEGRGPGTEGEELTVKYLVDEFTRLGLKPGNTDGTFLQRVPLVG